MASGCPSWHPSLYLKPRILYSAVASRAGDCTEVVDSDNSGPPCLSCSDNLMETTTYWTTLHYLCASHNVRAMKLFHDKHPRTFERQYVHEDALQRVPVHICCILDHFEVLSELLQRAPPAAEVEVLVQSPPVHGDAITARSSDDMEYVAVQLALHNDAWWSLQELVVWKLESGSSGPDALPKRWADALVAYRWSMQHAMSGACSTAPGVAARRGRLDAWPLYVHGQPAMHASLTILHIACIEPSLHRLAIVLCRSCSDLCGVATASGCVPLHIGAQIGFGNSALLKALLRGDEMGHACITANRADLSVLPVHVLARYALDGEEVVAWLSKTSYALRRDMHVSGIVDGKGWTVLHHACHAMASSGDINHFSKVKCLVRSWGISLDTPSTGLDVITPRQIVEQSKHAATLLALLGSIADFCESYDF